MDLMDLDAPLPRISTKEISMRGRNKKHLRSGGFGAVYAATYCAPSGEHIPVAVKYYKSKLMETGQQVSAFWTEAQEHFKLSLLGLRHGVNIVTMFGVLEEPSRRRTKYAIVMRRMRCSLADLIASALPLSLGARLRMLLQVCDALALMHEAHYQHLDMKPENVLLDERNDAFISDFGLSRQRRPTPAGAAAARTSHAGAGAVGTPGYICPEVGQRQAPRGPATDIFALGILSWELLAMQRAWPGPADIAADALNRMLWVDNARPNVSALEAVRQSSPAMATLLALLPQCWSSDSSCRPSARHVADATRSALSGLDPSAAVPPPLPPGALTPSTQAAAVMRPPLRATAAAAFQMPTPPSGFASAAARRAPLPVSGEYFAADGSTSAYDAKHALPLDRSGAIDCGGAISGVHALLPPPKKPLLGGAGTRSHVSYTAASQRARPPVSFALPELGAGTSEVEGPTTTDFDETAEEGGDEGDASEETSERVGTSRSRATSWDDSDGDFPIPGCRRHRNEHHHRRPRPGGHRKHDEPPRSVPRDDIRTSDADTSPAAVASTTPAPSQASSALSKLRDAVARFKAADFKELSLLDVLPVAVPVMRRTLSGESSNSGETGGSRALLGDSSQAGSLATTLGGSETDLTVGAAADADDHAVALSPIQPCWEDGDASTALDVVVAAITSAAPTLVRLAVAVVDDTWWGHLFRAIATCSQLSFLTVRGCFASSSTRGVCHLAFSTLHMPQLSHICLAGVHLTDNAMFALAAVLPELRELKGLELRFTGMRESGFSVLGPVIARLASLEVLDLSGNTSMLGEGDCSDELVDLLQV
jgi:serine/threonine protein kinase